MSELQTTFKKGELVPLNMHNLLDFDLKGVTKRKKLKRNEDTSKAIQTTQSICDLYNSSITLYQNSIDKHKAEEVIFSSLDRIIEQTNKTMLDATLEHVLEHGDIPKDEKNFIHFTSFYEYESRKSGAVGISDFEEYIGRMTRQYSCAIDKISKTPTTKLGNIVDIADQMNLVIIPIEYLDERSYSQEKYGVVYSIKEFSKVSSDIGMDTYVICPVSHYSIKKHIDYLSVEGHKNYQIYSGVKFTHIFESIEMLLPILCELGGRLTKVERDIETTATNMDFLNKRINELDTKIQQVADRLEREINDRRTTEENRLLHELQKLQTTKSTDMNSLSFWDPMVFSMAANKSLFDRDALAFVGPCWGPEIPELFLRLNKISVKNQKDTKSKLIQQIFK